MVNAVNTVAAALPGIDQQITELDVSVYNAGDDTSNYGNNLPPVILAEQGWLYNQTFDAFKELSGKVSAVTMWGMADDDTWLDELPYSKNGLPSPVRHGTAGEAGVLGHRGSDEAARLWDDLRAFDECGYGRCAHADRDGNERHRGYSVCDAAKWVHADADVRGRACTPKMTAGSTSGGTRRPGAGRVNSRCPLHREHYRLQSKLSIHAERPVEFGGVRYGNIYHESGFQPRKLKFRKSGNQRNGAFACRALRCMRPGLKQSRLPMRCDATRNNEWNSVLSHSRRDKTAS